MRRIWNKLRGGKCQHSRTLVVTSVGVRRDVCTDCGHISFRMPAESTTRAPKATGAEPPLDHAAGM